MTLINVFWILLSFGSCEQPLSEKTVTLIDDTLSADSCFCYIVNDNGDTTVIGGDQLDVLGIESSNEESEYFRSKFSETELIQLRDKIGTCPWVFLLVSLKEREITSMDIRTLDQKQKDFFQTFENRFVGDSVNWSFLSQDTAPAYTLRICLSQE